MGIVIKALVPTRWRLKVKAWHNRLWRPVACERETYYYGECRIPEYYMPRTTFFPRKKDTPGYHKLDVSELDFSTGEARLKPRTVWKHFCSLESDSLLSVGVAVATVLLVLGAIGLVGFGIAKFATGLKTCGGYIEGPGIVEQCAAEQGMTVEEYNNMRGVK